MLDDGEEGGVRLWHLVKASEESELPKHRRGSLRERGGERAKAIPEIYLTRLLSMKVKLMHHQGGDPSLISERVLRTYMYHAR